MGTTKIEWTDFVFNPWIGCSKVAAGCLNCYAENMMDHRFGKVRWGPGGTRVMASEETWRGPVAWNRKAKAGECLACNGGRKKHTHDSGYGYAVCEHCGGTGLVGQYRRRVFCASLADIFENWEGPMLSGRGRHLVHANGRWEEETTEQHESCSGVTMADARERLFNLIDRTPDLDWLLLTKRPQNVPHMWPDIACDFCGEVSCGVHRAGVIDRRYRHNVFLGCSVSDQATADELISELLGCRDLAPVLFVSAEPLVGPVSFGNLFWRWGPTGPRWDVPHDDNVQRTTGAIDWVIVGGESGPSARPCNIDWVRSVVLDCELAGVPCFTKQLGSNVQAKNDHVSDWFERCGHLDLRPTERFQGAVGQVRGFRDPKGGDPEEWPDGFPREFPGEVARYE